MAPIAYHHQPLSSFSLSNHDEPPSCSNIASGVGSSSHPISPSQFYINQSQLSISHCPQLILSQSAIHHLLWTTRSANLQIRKTALRTWSLLPVQLQIQFQLQVWLSQALVLQADLLIALILSTLHFINNTCPMWNLGLNLFNHQQKHCIWCLVVCSTLWHQWKTPWATATCSG